MNARPAPQIARFPGIASAPDAISVLGITPAGAVALVAVGGAIRLPECSPGPAALRDVQERLREETGYEATEFVLMTHSSAPEGPMPTLLLAPRLVRVCERPRGLELVPLVDLLPWLNARKAAGMAVDPRVSLGALLAERHFPRWALSRLQEALLVLRASAPSNTAVAG